MAQDHIKVLLIEDDPGDVRLIWEILSEIRSSPFYLSVADSLLKGLKEIEKDKPDIILLDLNLRDSNGIYTLNRVRDKAKVVPIVIITGMDDEATAIQALKEGAQEYLVKGRIDSDMLKKALIYSMERFSLVLEIEEKRVRLEEQDKIKYNYIHMIFHELVIPTTAIKNAISSIENKKIESKQDENASAIYFAMIKKNVDNISFLLNDLINVSENEVGTFGVNKVQLDMKELIENYLIEISAYALAKHIKISVEIPKALRQIKADARRIKQALNNLIVNSISFSEIGSAIVISVSETDVLGLKVPEYVRESCSAGKLFQIISVKDSGAGIDSKRLVEIFDNFFSSKIKIVQTSKGIGMGLVIAKNIVNAHGGCMWVESKGKGKGSVFNIVIPEE
ncbi:MAG: hybrid sensor histidine kinase/response regulator [bacterium]